MIKEVVFKGEFWKSCPGTGGGYLCCGYQVLTPLRGCAMYCRYCILQVYYEEKCRVLFSNYADLEREVERKMRSCQGVVRFGTGEFADSLYGEDTLRLSCKVASTLAPYQNAIVEFKTKSDAVAALGSIRRPERVVVGFSVNTPRMIERYEKGTASLGARLSAAGTCEAMGFSVAFHFDPLIWYSGCEKEYREVVRAIYAHVKDRRRIAWCSMGGFRTPLSLKKHLRDSNEHLPLFSGEMLPGTDGKLRYFRPYRVTMYSALLDEFEKHDPGVALYLCMESREIWEATGMAERIPRGLSAYLDSRAEVLLRAAGR
jgi:spore photoproduct lyase